MGLAIRYTFGVNSTESKHLRTVRGDMLDRVGVTHAEFQRRTPEQRQRLLETAYQELEQKSMMTGRGKDSKESKYIDGPDEGGEYSAGASIDGDTAQRAGFKTYGEAAEWVRVMLQKLRRQKASIGDSYDKRTRLHKALDRVLDSRARAKDADFCECESSRCFHTGSCPRSEGLKRYSVGGYRQTLCPYCARQAQKYCESSKLPFQLVGTL